jgi:hypothetical protein
MEEGVLPGKLRHRRQGGDGHGVEAIAMRSSSSMSESTTRCVIADNMEDRDTGKLWHRWRTWRRVTGELRHRCRTWRRATGELRHQRRTCGVECIMAARSR